MSEIKIKVRYAETDKMGIVHHSNYLVWYEVGRTEFIKNLGITYSKIESLGIMLPLFKASSKYIKPAFYEDTILIKTKIKKITPVKIEFEYNLYNQNNILINTGETSHAFVNKSMSVINIKKENIDIYNLLISNL